MTYKEYKKVQKNQRPCNMPANNNWEALSTLADANKAKKEEKARKKQERRDNIVASAILYDIMTRHK